MAAPAAALDRRAFLTGRRPSAPPRRPPGLAAGGLDACTGCGACAAACPTRIIAIAGGRPALDFARGECLLCGECAAACPEPVFDAAAPPAFDHVVAISAACLTEAGIACMTCRDACPEDAIRFVPRIGRPFAPRLDASACTGCGACIAPCPAAAIAVAMPQAEAIDG